MCGFYRDSYYNHYFRWMVFVDIRRHQRKHISHLFGYCRTSFWSSCYRSIDHNCNLFYRPFKVIIWSILICPSNQMLDLCFDLRLLLFNLSFLNYIGLTFSPGVNLIGAKLIAEIPPILNLWPSMFVRVLMKRILLAKKAKQKWVLCQAMPVSPANLQPSLFSICSLDPLFNPNYWKIIIYWFPLSKLLWLFLHFLLVYQGSWTTSITLVML